MRLMRECDCAPTVTLPVKGQDQRNWGITKHDNVQVTGLIPPDKRN